MTEQKFRKHPPVKLLLNGPSGAGKTHFAATFPRSHFLFTEPGGADTFLYKKNLRENVQKYEYFIPSPVEDIKEVFNRLKESCVNAHKAYAAGEIDTLVLDNATYLSENRWIYINKYERITSTKTGELDTRGMYRVLQDYLYQFVLMNMCSFPGNVVISCHEKKESEEKMAKKATDDDIVSNILGGFRDQINGLVSHVFFLDKVPAKEKGKYRYLCRTNKGNNKNAKSRLDLPEVIENASYATIAEAIEKAMA